MIYAGICHSLSARTECVSGSAAACSHFPNAIQHIVCLSTRMCIVCRCWNESWVYWYIREGVSGSRIVCVWESILTWVCVFSLVHANLWGPEYPFHKSSEDFLAWTYISLRELIETNKHVLMSKLLNEDHATHFTSKVRTFCLVFICQWESPQKYKHMILYKPHENKNLHLTSKVRTSGKVRAFWLNL